MLVVALPRQKRCHLFGRAHEATFASEVLRPQVFGPMHPRAEHASVASPRRPSLLRCHAGGALRKLSHASRGLFLIYGGPGIELGIGRHHGTPLVAPHCVRLQRSRAEGRTRSCFSKLPRSRLKLRRAATSWGWCITCSARWDIGAPKCFAPTPLVNTASRNPLQRPPLF